MLQGMTGFGSATARFGRVNILVEIKSLNHKFFEAVLHLPEGLLSLEEGLKKIIAAKIRRGRVNLILNISGLPQETVVLNSDIVRRYSSLLRELRQQLKIKDSVNLADIIHLPGIFVLEKRLQADKKISRLLQGLARQALEGLLKMRAAEGRAIAKDLVLRIKDIRNTCEAIKKRAGLILRIKQKALPGEEFEAYQKATDVTEEVLRLNLHLKNFLLSMHKNDAVGKELDFISQELQRETNTIGAKSQDATVSGLVIKIKTQIEKIREQLQNVE